MNKRLLAVAMGAALVGTSAAVAAPFNSFDPRSMGMGGAGVAEGNASTASFFNPALLSVTKASDDFSTELPIVGVRAYDPKDLLTGLEDFQDADLINQLTAAGSDADRASIADQLLYDTSTGFPAISEKPVQGEVGVATVIGIPSKSYGAAFFLNAWMTGSGVAHYTEEDRTALENIRDLCASSDPACVNAVNDFTPTSSLEVRGVSLAEVGVSLAREFTVFNAPVAIGITPKYVMATTFDYSADVNDASLSDLQESDYINEQSNFNLDLGIARNFENGWRSGLVVKNIIPQEYDFVQTIGGVKVKTDSLKLSPQARIGTSYQNSWFTLAMDVDLTENDPVGFEEKTRYVSVGTELNAADWAQLRLGYRADTVNNERSVASAGLGLSPFGVHMDFAVAGNANELGAAFQLGVRF